MILENGVIRTMDPSLPTTRALAIAGAKVAGGVGTHELALPSPDVVDLGGRCVLPGFTDSHVHFPTWSLSQREVKLDGVAGLADALERVRAHPRHGSWIRGYGWRSAEWDEQPTAAALDSVTGETPALLFSNRVPSAVEWDRMQRAESVGVAAADTVTAPPVSQRLRATVYGLLAEGPG